MKGISPIVAAVLLIAITMTLAGGLALWATKLVGKQLPEPETEVQCKLAGFDFLSCKYNASTGNLIFSLSNRRTVELKNLTAFISYPNGSSSSGINLNSTLEIGANAVKSFTISGIPSDFSEILIKTHCPDIEVSDKCIRS
jgi:flagellin-like protein